MNLNFSQCYIKNKTKNKPYAKLLYNAYRILIDKKKKEKQKPHKIYKQKKKQKKKNCSGFIVKQYFINLRIASTFFSLLQKKKKKKNENRNENRNLQNENLKKTKKNL